MLNTISGLLGEGAPAGGDYESIATTTVGSGGTSTVTFSSIPSTYTHLQIRMLARTSRSSLVDTIRITYNSDTTVSNYTYHELVGDGSSVAAYGAGSDYNQLQGATGASASSNVFGVGVTDILDYANTNKYKTLRNLGGLDNNGSGRVAFVSGLWINTSAISSITLTATSGTIQQYSSFALYGIK